MKACKPALESILTRNPREVIDLKPLNPVRPREWKRIAEREALSQTGRYPAMEVPARMKE